jgi:hypothetical protein
MRWLLLPIKIPLVVIGLMLSPIAATVEYSTNPGNPTWDQCFKHYVISVCRVV